MKKINHNPKTICINCTHCQEESCLVECSESGSSIYFCGFITHEQGIDRVTGKSYYINGNGDITRHKHPICGVINTNGNCQYYRTRSFPYKEDKNNGK